MPKIKAKLAKEPEEGKTYEVVEAKENIATLPGGQQATGIRVTLKDALGNEAGTMLWMREVASETSKLGSFLATLGDDTDTWKGKRITFVTWRERKRQIALATPK